jgi:murein DD-endopeptidase MepM/ murein hydrolase activator NlpD
MNVRPGQQISKGSVVGAQGNSGNTYSNSGGDGTHLDVTIYDSSGNPYSSREVAQLLGVQSIA